MGNWNRIWILFVIVAVGLVLSWQQVGRRTAEVASKDDRILRTESPCMPAEVPCAALGMRRGVVLGPVVGQPGTLVLHPAGFGPTGAELRVSLQGDGGDVTAEVNSKLVSRQGYWTLDLQHYDPQRDRALRVEVRTDGVRLLAEFPLR